MALFRITSLDRWPSEAERAEMLSKFRIEHMDTAEIASEHFISECSVYNALIRARGQIGVRSANPFAFDPQAGRQSGPQDRM